MSGCRQERRSTVKLNRAVRCAGKAAGRLAHRGRVCRVCGAKGRAGQGGYWRLRDWSCTARAGGNVSQQPTVWQLCGSGYLIDRRGSTCVHVLLCGPLCLCCSGRGLPQLQPHLRYRTAPAAKSYGSSSAAGSVAGRCRPQRLELPPSCRQAGQQFDSAAGCGWRCRRRSCASGSAEPEALWIVEGFHSAPGLDSELAACRSDHLLAGRGDGRSSAHAGLLADRLHAAEGR